MRFVSALIRCQRGFSMIEVMVTLLLICIGVLGMVALQTRAVQYTQDSVQRSAAIALANDLVELMRTSTSSIQPNVPDGYLKADGASFPSAPAAGCATTSFDPAQQLACWSERAKQRLPGATDLLASDYHVCRSKNAGVCSVDGSAVEVQIAWRVKPGQCLNDGDSSTETICRYTLRVQL